MREVTMQELSDCGLNPFALKLLVESWQGHPSPQPVAFLLWGVPFAVGHDPDALRHQIAELTERCRLLREALAAIAGDLCHYDRSGICHAHGDARPCRAERARAVLASTETQR